MMTPAEQHRIRQARYRRTAKGKAAQARYNRGAAHRAACARYRATRHGQQVSAETNARRIFIGRAYHGRAQTIDQAHAIHAYAKERIREFIAGQ